MNFNAVQAQLNDIPTTFKRSNGDYQNLIDSFTVALSRFTLGSDGYANQLYVSNAVDGWLDVWGLLVGIPRNTGEGNLPYYTRIQNTILAVVGTLPALQIYVTNIIPGAIVKELGSTKIGYTITIPTTVTSSQIQLLVSGINNIRPAGVPFTIGYSISPDGLFLDTINFLDDGNVQGDYLTSTSASTASITLYASQNNLESSFPTLYLTDQTLNVSQPDLLFAQNSNTGNIVNNVIEYYTPTVLSPLTMVSGAITVATLATLPTSPVGLPSGTWWDNSGLLAQVP